MTPSDVLRVLLTFELWGWMQGYGYNVSVWSTPALADAPFGGTNPCAQRSLIFRSPKEPEVAGGTSALKVWGDCWDILMWAAPESRKTSFRDTHRGSKYTVFLCISAAVSPGGQNWILEKLW